MSRQVVKKVWPGRTSRTLATALLVLAVGAGACGGGNGGGLSPEASATLAGQVQGVRAAAEAGDREAATQRLQVLRATVTRLRAADELSEDRAADILASATTVESRLGLLPTTTTTTTAAPVRRGDDDEDRGKGKGKDEDD